MKINNILGSVVVGITGAVIGAGLAVSGTIALKDNKTKAKVKNLLFIVKDQLKHTKIIVD